MAVDDPSITLIGPGAIGTCVAGALAASGHRPTVVGRTGFDRIAITFPGGRFDGDVACSTSVEDLEHADVVVLAMKAHQTPGAAAALERAVGPSTVVIVAQHGVEQEAVVRPFVPASAEIVPVVVMLPARRDAPGVVEMSRAGTLSLPDTVGARRFAALVDCEFLAVETVDDFVTATWRKLMLNAVSGGIGSLVRRDPSVLQGDEQGHALALAMMREVATVARAEGADLSDEFAVQMTEGFIQRAGSHLASIVVDRLNGVATEWEARNGVVLRKAAEHGIDVPVNTIVTTLLRLGEPDGNRGESPS